MHDAEGRPDRQQHSGLGRGFHAVDTLRRLSRQVHLQRGARKLHAVLDSSAAWRPRERTDRRTLSLTGNPASRARRSIPRASQLLGAKPQTFTEFTTYRLRKATVLKALADARAATRPRGMEATAPRSVHPAPRPGLPRPRGQ